MFSWPRRSSLPLNNHFRNIADLFDIATIAFIALLIFFVAKPIFLKSGKTSPVPSWFFNELAARSILF
jgi:hypothetical protein